MADSIDRLLLLHKAYFLSSSSPVRVEIAQPQPIEARRRGIFIPDYDVEAVGVTRNAAFELPQELYRELTDFITPVWAWTNDEKMEYGYTRRREDLAALLYSDMEEYESDSDTDL